MNLNPHVALSVEHPSRSLPAVLLKSVIAVNASQRLDTAAGRLLGRMYYGSFIDKTLSHGESTGYPNNGGEHTFRLHMKPADIVAFLELVEESFAGHVGMPEFVASVKARAIEKHPRLAELFGGVQTVH